MRLVRCARRAPRAAAGLLAAAGLALAAIGAAQAQAQCRVLDPELQGSYAGGCRDGLAEGVGRARGIAEYRGAFRAGAKHGHGVKTWPSGDRYEGEFAQDRKHGQGTYTWGALGPWAGERYSGAFAGDRRQGAGSYAWPDGRVYNGRFEDDAPLDPLPGELSARSRMEAERAVAAAKPGISVCRALPVGVGLQDWIRGTVLGAAGDEIELRIDEPGRYQQLLNGVPLARGVQLHDAAWRWTPCL